MANRFHLAIPAGDLNVAVKFYCDLLGCNRGNSEANSNDSWVDIDFWGNELTLHASQPDESWRGVRHEVDMDKVVVPHFGVHLSAPEFEALKQRIEGSGISYVDDPYIRFRGTEFEQETFFIADPVGNILEIKTMKNPDKLFEKKAVEEI